MRFLGTSPGNGIQLEHGTHRGRLLAPVYYNHEEEKPFHVPRCTAMTGARHGTSVSHRMTSANFSERSSVLEISTMIAARPMSQR